MRCCALELVLFWANAFLRWWHPALWPLCACAFPCLCAAAFLRLCGLVPLCLCVSVLVLLAVVPLCAFASQCPCFGAWRLCLFCRCSFVPVLASLSCLGASAWLCMFAVPLHPPLPPLLPCCRVPACCAGPPVRSSFGEQGFRLRRPAALSAQLALLLRLPASASPLAVARPRRG